MCTIPIQQVIEWLLTVWQAIKIKSTIKAIKINQLLKLYMHFPDPLHTSKTWHKVIFIKPSFKGLNSEFSFSKTSYHAYIKETVCLTVNQ